MIKLIIFDADGMVITNDGYFSDRINIEYGAPKDSLQQFFSTDFRQTSIGKENLNDILQPYLKEWNWPGTVDELIEYWLTGHSTLNKDLLSIIKQLRTQQINCVLATNQEKNRLKYLKHELGLYHVFDHIYCSCEIGHLKPSTEYFDHIMTKHKVVKKSEILFWDDRPKYVDAATKYGFNAHVFKSNKQFVQTVNSYFPLPILKP